MTKNIPIYQPFLKGNERKYVLDCMDSNWISSKGKYVRGFEESIEDFIGNISATSCSNGTVALHLALLALEIGPGDEVIVPSFTYIASVNAIKYVGATPVFVDSESGSWNASSNTIKNKITPSTKAIMCVHIYGNPCDLDPIFELAKENNLKVIEDCAEALGSKYKNEHVGVNSDISTFSFFGNKTITTGEGGMVFSKDSDLVEKVAHLKNQSVSQEIAYWHDLVGYNYRLTNVASAIGLAQMEKVDEILELKRNIASLYNSYLKNLDLSFQEILPESVSSYWLNVIKTPSTSALSRIKDNLTQAGVEVRPAFPLVSKMPPYKEMASQQFPSAKGISETALCLPSYPDLRESDIKFISELISSSINEE
jgi:perosamine synthetase